MESSWNRAVLLFGGLAAGASLMYLLDPDRGHARRALARDKAGSLVLHTSTAAGRNVRNMRNHARGVLHNVTSLASNRPSDIDLENQIRAEIERLVARPELVHVTVHRSRVTVSGPVLAVDVQNVVDGVAMVPGVTAVDNRLTVYQSVEEIPSMPAAQETPSI